MDAPNSKQSETPGNNKESETSGKDKKDETPGKGKEGGTPDIEQKPVGDGEETNFYVQTSLAGKAKYLKSEFLVTSKDYLPLFGLKEIDNTKAGSKLFRAVRVYQFVDKIYAGGSGPRIYYVSPGHKKLKNANPVQLVVCDSSSNSSPDNHAVVYVNTVLSDENQEEIVQLGMNITEFISETIFWSEDAVHHLVKLKADYIQKKRIFEEEDKLRTTKKLVVLEDDTFETDLEEEFVEAEKEFGKLFEGKMELSKKLEEKENDGGEEQEDDLLDLIDNLDKLKKPENSVEDLLEDLDKLKVDKS